MTSWRSPATSSPCSSTSRRWSSGSGPPSPSRFSFPWQCRWTSATCPTFTDCSSRSTSGWPRPPSLWCSPRASTRRPTATGTSAPSGSSRSIVILLGALIGAYFIPADMRLGPMVAAEPRPLGKASRSYRTTARSAKEGIAAPWRPVDRRGDLPHGRKAGRLTAVPSMRPSGRRKARQRPLNGYAPGCDPWRGFLAAGVRSPGRPFTPAR